jgi:anti-anti-sigma factor
MESKHDTVQVGYKDDLVLIRITGRGIFVNCQFLKRHINEILDQGYKKVVVDCRDCDYMDSSFLGSLTGIAIRLRKQYNTKLEMANMKPKVKETLYTIGLNHIFRLVENRDLSGIPITTVLPLDPGDHSSLAQNMLEAHDHLIEINQDNKERFSDVRDALKKELGQDKKDD